MTASTVDPNAETVAVLTASAWRPTAGDSITGTVKRLSTRETEYGKYLVVTLDTGDGAYTAIHCFHTVLKNVMWEIKPEIGSKISVYYHGKVDRNQDKPSYHSYTVIDPDAPAEAEFDWGTVADQSAPGF